MNDWHDDEDITVNRNSFVFYDSFYRAMDYLTEEEKMEYIDAICHYSLYDIRIDMSPKIAGMFELVKHKLMQTSKKEKMARKVDDHLIANNE